MSKYLAPIGIAFLLSYPNSSFAQASSPPQKNAWTINLKDVDIKSFIEEVSRLTEETFVIDPRVNGKVTIISQEPLNKEELLTLFSSTLNANGYTVIPQGNQNKIAPLSQGKIEATTNTAGKPEYFETKLIKLSQISAEDVLPVIRPLLPAHASASVEKISNSIIITDQASSILRIEEVLKKIEETASSDISVYSLKYASITQIADAINDLAAKISKDNPNRLHVVGDTRSNRLIIKGSRQDKERIISVARQLDVPASQASGPLVVRLKHGDAKNIVKSLEKLSKSLGLDEENGEKTYITADTQLNAVIIMAPRHHHESIQSLISKLDVSRAQVMVDAAIVEVSGDISEALGVQWAIDGRGAAGAGVINFGDTGLSVGTVLKAIDDKKAPSTLPNGVVLGLGNDNFGALVTALSSNSSTNLLSTPSLLTLDNQEAEILVGQNVPFQTGSYATSGSGVANPFQTIERQDVGVTLKVTPHINEGNTLRMDIVQEISSIALTAQNVAAVDLITNKRSIKSTVLANDGQVIVLGGLIQDDITKSESKVPLLSSLPFIGNLFKSTKDVNIKRNLLVLIRPRVIREEETLTQISQEKYRHIRMIGEDGEQALPLPDNSEELFEPGALSSNTQVLKQPADKPLTTIKLTPAVEATVQENLVKDGYLIQIMSSVDKNYLEKILNKYPDVNLKLKTQINEGIQKHSLIIGPFTNLKDAKITIDQLPEALRKYNLFIRRS